MPPGASRASTFRSTRTTRPPSPELKQRIAKTLDFIKSIKASQLEGAETRPIELKCPNRTLTFTGLSYVNNFVLPNFYFHESMAYAILRHNGVEVGKCDFLGEM